MEIVKNILDFYYERNQLKYDKDYDKNRTRSDAEIIYDRIMTAVVGYSEFCLDDSLSNIIRILCSPMIIKYPMDDEEGKEELNSSIDKILGLEYCLNKNKYNFDEVSQFYNDASSLKSELQQEQIYFRVKNNRIESVAEHVFGTLMLALAIESEYSQDINMDKVLEMLALHEIEKIKRENSDKQDTAEIKDCSECTYEVLRKLKKHRHYQSLINEFKEKKTKEAIFANLIDKLEYLLQAKSNLEEDASVFDTVIECNKETFKGSVLFERLFEELKKYKINNPKSLLLK